MFDFEFVISDGPRQGARFPFPGTDFTLGSGETVTLRLEGRGVQPRHAQLFFDDDGVIWLRDLTGEGQLWIDGTATWEGRLEERSVVRLGELELRVEKTPVATMSQRRATGPETRAAPRTGLEPLHPTLSKPQGLQPGDVIDDRYRIEERLATGGMGEVYRATHIELGKTVAIKVMLADLSRDPDFVARFKREAIAASRVGQQNIVDIYDFGRTHGLFYFAMEYLAGLTLTQVVRQEGPQPVERAVAIGLQVARALAAAHDAGIIHRDLKPENVMLLQRPGQPDLVKVLDFGIAKVNDVRSDSHTAVGMVVGTPQYMSPEQVKALPVDARTDVYLLGLILYELVAGRRVFTAQSPSAIMVKQVTEAPEPLPTGAVPSELGDLIFRMLEKEPDRRPATMHVVVDELDALWARLKVENSQLTSGPIQVSATPRPGAHELPSSGSGLKVMLAVVVLALVGGGGFIAFQLARPSAPAELPTPPPKPTPTPTPTPTPVAPPPKPGADAPSVPTPPPKPEVRTITLTLTTEPSGAEVYENDVMVGMTPLALSRAEGTTTQLRFSAKGFKSAERKVGFVADQALRIELERLGKAVKSPKAPPLLDNPYAQPDELKTTPY